MYAIRSYYDILPGLVEAADLAAHLFGYGESGSIVSSAIDSLTARELLYIPLQVVFDNGGRPLGIHSAHVVVNNHL